MRMYKKLFATGFGLALLFAGASAHAVIVHFDFASQPTVSGNPLVFNDEGGLGFQISVSTSSGPTVNATRGGLGVRVDGPDNSILDGREMLVFSINPLPPGTGLQLQQIEFAALTNQPGCSAANTCDVDIALNATSFNDVLLTNLRDFGRTDGPLGPRNDWLVPGGFVSAPGSDLKITSLSLSCLIQNKVEVSNCEGYRIKELWFTTVTLAQVPEPGTLALLGIALVALGFMRRRRVY